MDDAERYKKVGTLSSTKYATFRFLFHTGTHSKHVNGWIVVTRLNGLDVRDWTELNVDPRLVRVSIILIDIFIIHMVTTT